MAAAIILIVDAGSMYMMCRLVFVRGHDGGDDCLWLADIPRRATRRGLGLTERKE